MTTVSDIVTLALKDIGVLDETDTPSAALMSDSIATLNQMLGLWQADGLLVYAQVDSSHNMTGALTYTVGTGGNFNITAPVKIDFAYYRVGGLDYPVEVLSNWDDYLAITLKAVPSSYPTVLYYNPTVPLATIYLYPQPSSGVLHIVSDVQLPYYANSAASINLPSEYDMAVRLSLGEILLEMMGSDRKRPMLAKMATQARRILKRNNTKIKCLDLGGEDNLSHYARILGGI